jgi:hypothetical protein
MDAGVAAVLAALITATGAVLAAMLMRGHKQPDIPRHDEHERAGLKTHTVTTLPPLPPLEPYKTAGPSRTASTTTVSPEPWTAPGVIGGRDATVKYAGFWVRLLAGLIDVGIFAILFVMAVVAILHL